MVNCCGSAGHCSWTWTVDRHHCTYKDGGDNSKPHLEPHSPTDTKRVPENPTPSTPEIQPAETQSNQTRPTFHPYSTAARFQQEQYTQPWNPQGQFTHNVPTTTPISTQSPLESSPEEETLNLSDLSTPSSPSSLTFSSQNPSLLWQTLAPSPPSPFPTPSATSALPQVPTTHHVSNWGESLAWEGSNDLKSKLGQILREIKMQINRDGLTNNKQMVNCLKVNLQYGSEADLWFSSLKSTEKDTYIHLEATFKLQYPLITQPKCSKAERVRALKEWITSPFLVYQIRTCLFPWACSFKNF